MARVVEAFAFRRLGDNGRGKYPWAEWTDGQTRELTKGIDFHTGTDSFRNAAYHYGKNNGFWVSVNVRGDRVYVRFTRRGT